MKARTLVCLAAGVVVAFFTSRLEASITLDLASPAYEVCGRVSINGYVAASPGAIQRLVWVWGDGATNESWFPATHTFPTNGDYTVEVTAFANTGETKTVTAAVVITDACNQSTNIVLSLAAPAYEACGQVSINGYVAASQGAVQRLVWAWGDGATNESWFPATHVYPSNGVFAVTVTAHSSLAETRTATQQVSVATISLSCDNTLRVYPPRVVLKDGKTNEILRVDLRGKDGLPIPVTPAQSEFVSTKPELVEVDVQGRVTGNGLGEAQIEVRVQGQPRTVIVPVTVGEILLEPTIFLLNTNQPTPGQLFLRAFNADGSTVNLSGKQVQFSGGNAVASVDAQGVVTPLCPPAQFWDSPYLNATLDGMPARNACLVRVTATNLNLTMQDYAGENVTFRVATQVGPYAYGALMNDLQVVEVFDAVYRLQQRLCGTTPHQGGRQFFALDPGVDADGTVPCGLSGNPVRLGLGVDNLRSCFGGENWLHWGVIGHELAHDFLSHASFADFCSGLGNSGAYSEGLATALSAYSFDEIASAPERFGIAPAALANFHGIFLMPDSIRSGHYAALTNYEANPDYAGSFNADLLDAIMLKLGDDHGPAFLFRFLSVFYPPDEVFMNYQNDTQRLTFWVAACSAAARTDLRTRFRDGWGFPVDDDYYESILPQVQQRAAQRDPMITASRINPGVFHLSAHAIRDTAYFIQSSLDLNTWTTVQTNIPVTFTLEADLPISPGAGQQFYRVMQWR